jgi:hypothetical protein
MCSFCSNNETIQHLFFDCVHAKFICRVIHVVTELAPPNNIRHIFGAWVWDMNSRDRQIFLVGIGAMLWAIWLSHNDVVFYKIPISFSMQVIFRGTYWTRTWSEFQKKDKKKMALVACRLIETTTMKIFASHGWWPSNRLSF